MKNCFQDIMYPSSRDQLEAMVDKDADSFNAKIILLPHAEASFVASFYSSALKNMDNKKILFLAPLHNERLQEYKNDSLLTVSSAKETELEVISAPNLKAADYILEEEYTLELFLAFLSVLSQNTEVVPVFASLESRKDIKTLENYIKCLDYDVVIISGNFAEGNNNEEALRQAKLLSSLLENNISLIDEGNRKHITGCAWPILEAVRKLSKGFKIISARANGGEIGPELMPAEGKVYQVFGVFK